MGKVKTMHYQVSKILGETACFGRSKHCDKKPSNNYHPYGIYSVVTKETYIEQAARFGEWCRDHYGEKDIRNCKEYIIPYLDSLVVMGRSPSTIHTYKFAIQKLFDALEHGFKVEYETTKRERAIIQKNSSSIAEVKEVDEDKYSFALTFGLATGLRRSEMLTLRYSDVRYDRNKNRYSVFVFKGKGGKRRTVPVPKKYNEFFDTLHALSEGHQNLFYVAKHSDITFGSNGNVPAHLIPSRFPEHRCRREYTKRLYLDYARDTRDITDKHELYYCRKEKKGVTYDRIALLKVSEALGHGRESVISSHYLD